MGSGFSKYDRTETNQSIYCYKDSNVLINKEEIRIAKDLAKFEADTTIIRQYELENENLIKGRFGVAHLKKIHKYIFQDVYPFAGKIRLEDITKGHTVFCKSEYIAANLENILTKLKNENYLSGLDMGEFSKKAAYYLAEINMVHPFREGNGRTIREFIRQLALRNEYIINWSLIDRDTLLQATIIAVKNDYGPLSECVYQAIEK